MDSENEEEAVISYKAKYRQLKNRLKYLIYEHECFENDIQKAQMKLLQLSRDKSETTEQSNKPPSSVSTSLRGTAEQPVTKPAASGSGAKNTAGTLLQTSSPAVAATTAPSSAPSPLSSRSGSLGKSGVSRKTTKAAGTKVSAMAVAKITKAVARARQNPQQSSPTIIATANNSPLIVSLPIGATTVGGRGKPHPQQATPMKNQPVMSLALGAPVQSTAAILASIPVPPKQPRSKPVTSSQPHPSGKGAPSGQPVGGVKGAGSQQASSTSSSSSSSDSEEDTGSDSSSSGSSREETAMDTRGPVPIVHSVPVPAGGPQLLRPKALASPVKAPPKLIPVSEHPSSAGAPSASSPMTTPTGGGATRFLWSNRVSAPSGSETTPTSGFVSIGPLASPTQLAKPSSGSAFQLVTSPPGASPLSRPPSLQELSGTEPAKPHPQP